MASSSFVAGETACPTPAKPAALQAPKGRLLDMWIGLRVFTVAFAILCATIRPLTPREAAIRMWPPSAPWLAWFERVVFAPWERWDAKLYVRIVASGYRGDDFSTTFHPLLPWLARPLTAIVGQPIVALWIVASVFSALAVLAIYDLARLDLSEEQSELACRLFLAFPLAAILFFPYTESLWIACAAVCLLSARRGQWWLAGIAAGAATLTRQQGLFLIVPMAWELARAWNRNWRAWVAVAMAPAAYGGWILYRGFGLGQALHPDFSSVHGLLYTTVLSPDASKVVPVQAMLWPTDALWRAISLVLKAPTMNNVVDLSLAGMFLIMTALAWGHLRPSYRAFVVAIVLASFAYYTGPEKPYMGLPRHLLLAFPVFIGAAPVFAPGKRRHVAALFFPCLIFLVVAYVLEAWVP